MSNERATRAYLEDPEQLDFRARIVDRSTLPDGSVAIVLDRTCFYPTSGGQPHDTGTLNGVAVFDVREDDDGRIVHLARADPGTDEVQGIVDATRRRDHMQQHSGQHLLSATFVALLGRETASFHLGAERCSIDLPGEPITSEQLDRVERRANAVVWESRPVRVRWLGKDDAAPALRKPPPPGVAEIRVVEIEAWDQSPCCGTHVRRTSDIGLVKLLAQERVRDSARVHFLCGQRAVEECTRALQRQEEIVRRLTCHPDEIAARLERMQQEPRMLRKQLESLQRELAGLRAAAWVHESPRWLGFPVIVRRMEPSAAEALRATADALVGLGAIALLASPGERVQLLFACPEDERLDLRPAMQAACALLGGRGGGPPHRVQGAGTRSDACDAALDAARQTLTGLGHTDFDKPGGAA
jgi:alanyl-tRNA synthetase